MPLHPHSFIHAANLRLDVPVSVQTAESLTDALRQRFEDATIDAFEFVIEECIARQVDWLLLSGNVFVEAERSLRARLALQRGCERLRQHEIDVVAIPGLGDPAEAWRAIPELPANVAICCSSDPAPVELFRGDDLIATVSASMWYGDPDSFGIRVIGHSEDGPEPFRVGVVSESSYAEARRVASLAQQETDESGRPLADPLAVSAMVPVNETEPTDDATGDESSDESLSLDVLEGPAEGAESSAEAAADDGPHDDRAAVTWNAGFVRYCDELIREGRLHYLTLMDELRRTELRRGREVLHAPGTTQPRHAREAGRGTCSLVEVSADGDIRLTEINTSAVNWKQLEVFVDPDVTLSGLLQQMKVRLAKLECSASDCVWSVQWTLRGPLPVLRSLQEDDLDVAVAVELDVLDVDGEELELLHSIRLVPDPWQPDDPDSLAGQFVEQIEQPQRLQRSRLQAIVRDNRSLTAGWKQRLRSLVPALDPERILARQRTDGAEWFVDDLNSLMPEILDQLTEQPEVFDDDLDAPEDRLGGAAQAGTDHDIADTPTGTAAAADRLADAADHADDADDADDVDRTGGEDGAAVDMTDGAHDESVIRADEDGPTHDDSDTTQNP